MDTLLPTDLVGQMIAVIAARPKLADFLVRSKLHEVAKSQMSARARKEFEATTRLTGPVGISLPKQRVAG